MLKTLYNTVQSHVYIDLEVYTTIVQPRQMSWAIFHGEVTKSGNREAVDLWRCYQISDRPESGVVRTTALLLSYAKVCSIITLCSIYNRSCIG